MRITNHAKERSKQRLRIPKKAIRNNIDKVIQNGIRHKDTKGRLKKYLDWLYFNYNNCNNVIYGRHIYVFSKTNTLITIIPLPSQYWKMVDKIQNNKDK